MDKLFHHSNGDMINYLGIMVKQLVYYYHLKVLFQMNIGCMMLIYKIIMVIVLEVIYINIITYIKMDNLNSMFKLILNKKHVVYV